MPRDRKRECCANTPCKHESKLRHATELPTHIQEGAVGTADVGSDRKFTQGVLKPFREAFGDLASQHCKVGPVVPDHAHVRLFNGGGIGEMS